MKTTEIYEFVNWARQIPAWKILRSKAGSVDGSALAS